uniref:CASP-like protein n=1 Tax=Hordeum vulgare subsp. vulgare TaxID=112509 RepID=A0A8I6WMU0_HORVV
MVLPSVVLALRLVAMLLLAGSLALIVADNINVRSDLFEGGRFVLKFKDIYTYRYVVAIAAIGCAYSLVQAPLAAVAIARKKRVIGGTANVALFLICADMIFVIAIATAAGASFWFSIDADRYVDGLYPDSLTKANPDFNRLRQDLDMFFVRASGAAVLMLLAAKCMAAVLVISVYGLVK